MTWLATLLVCCFAPLVVAQVEDRDALLKGVREVAPSGSPGPVIVFGAEAFAVVSATDRKTGERSALVAAARHGGGRVVVFGHTGYTGRQVLAKADTGRLMQNALRWAAAGRSAASREVRSGKPAMPVLDGLVVAAHKADGLQSLDGVRPRALAPRAWASGLEGVDVLVCGTGRRLSPAALRAVAAHLARGGGLIVTGLGWGWQQLNPGLDLRVDHPWHALLLPAGLAFGGGTLGPIDVVGDPVNHQAFATIHAGEAIEALAGGREDPLLCATVVRALRALPEEGLPFVDAVKSFVAVRSQRAIADGAPLVAPIEKLVATVAHQSAERGQASVHAADFPGAVAATAERRSVRVSIDLSTPGWASTGRYAAPGESLRVELPESAVRQGLGLRIGCHRDRLWDKKKWKRFPEITKEQPLTAASSEMDSPFGGPVYITVPKGLSGNCEVLIAGAVDAPWFVKGRTDLGAWRETLRHAPAPWAELQAEDVVLSVPSEVVRGLDDPQALLEFWDEVLSMYAELGARPLGDRPQRIVTDRQISAGYMHSGYPIMMGLDVRRTLVDVAAMKAARHGGVWGFWHELGHNHQQRAWTFGGTGEVTCNLFSLFVQERLSGVEPIRSHRLTPQRAKVEAFLAAGAPFAQWKKQPFLALYMYAELQAEFGWEAYQRAFAAYRDAAPGDLPKSDAEKRDQWLVRMSRATGRDLGPFFATWGVPVSDAARGQVADLPDWNR